MIPWSGSEILAQKYFGPVRGPDFFGQVWTVFFLKPDMWFSDLTLLELSNRVNVQLTEEVKQTIGSQPLVSLFNAGTKNTEPIAVIVLQMFDMIESRNLKL